MRPPVGSFVNLVKKVARRGLAANAGLLPYQQRVVHSSFPLLTITNSDELPRQASRKFSVERTIAGIRLPDRHTNHWDEAIRYEKDNTFSSPRDVWELVDHSTEIIPFYAKFNTALAGKLVKIKEDKQGKKSLYALSSLQEIKEVDGIVLLGLDTADDEKGIVSGIPVFEKLLENQGKNKNIVALYPKEARDRRYRDGLIYFINEKFTPKWAEQFVSDFIVPRLIDEKGYLLPPEEVPSLVLAGYSIGAREAIMIENATFDLLKSFFGKSLDEATPYMGRFFRLGIGCAVNWDKPSDTPSFWSLTVTSASDIGIRRMQSYMNGAFGDGDFLTKSVTIKHHYSIQNDKPREFLMLYKEIPAYIERNGEKRLNKLGHGLPHYGLAIERENQEQITTVIRKFREGKIEDRTEGIFSESKRFNPHQRMSEEIRNAIREIWSNHLYRQDILETYKENKPSSQMCNDSLNWRNIFAQKANAMPESDTPWKALLDRSKGR